MNAAAGATRPTFVPITDMLVEDIEMRPGYVWYEIRLLPGTKASPLAIPVPRQRGAPHTLTWWD
jgi:hypothetical protein